MIDTEDIFASTVFVGKGMVRTNMEKCESKGRVILTGLFDAGTFVEMGVPIEILLLTAIIIPQQQPILKRTMATP